MSDWRQRYCDSHIVTYGENAVQVSPLDDLVEKQEETVYWGNRNVNGPNCLRLLPIPSFVRRCTKRRSGSSGHRLVLHRAMNVPPVSSDVAGLTVFKGKPYCRGLPVPGIDTSCRI